MASLSRQSDGLGREALVWQEWLSLYIESCRATVGPGELGELATALPAAVADPASLSRLVDHDTAAEARFLISFLAGVADPHRRTALVAETITRLRSLAARHPAATHLAAR